LKLEVEPINLGFLNPFKDSSINPFGLSIYSFLGERIIILLVRKGEMFWTVP